MDGLPFSESMSSRSSSCKPCSVSPGLSVRCFRKTSTIMSGQPCRSQESVPSKSKTACEIRGRGAKTGLNSTGPLKDAIIFSPVESVSFKRSIMRPTIVNENSGDTNRRSFLKSVTAAATGIGLGLNTRALAADEPAASTAARPRIRLGFDNFSVRAMGWKADALLDYAASLKLDSILISDLDAYESFEEPYLKKVGAKAESLGIKLHAGTWSICPTS